MAGSKEIKNRIKSVQSTHQITKAMEIVSTTKFKKFSSIVESSKPYSHAIKEILKN
ncbi:MAG: F0F1 ATP synthase subunit gamma, partial [Fusobacteriaceae bacterium]